MEHAEVGTGDEFPSPPTGSVEVHFEDLELVKWYEVAFADQGRTVHDAHEGGPFAASDQRRVRPSL